MMSPVMMPACRATDAPFTAATRTPALFGISAEADTTMPLMPKSSRRGAGGAAAAGACGAAE